jgi:nucleotide-binding universal stress UspA family protein
MEIKNILVPVDFSESSKNALRIAIGLAKMNNACVHMINAVHIHAPHPDVTGGSLIESIINDYETQVQQSFDELEKEIVELNEVEHDSEKFVSYLTDAIYTCIKKQNIDLVVMGTRQQHEEIEHLLGTHATDVIGFSEVPVLVIPGGSKLFSPKKIAFATDLKKIQDPEKLESLKYFAEAFGSEITLFHITTNMSTVVPTGEKMEEAEKLENYLGNLKYNVDIIEEKKVSEGIFDFIKEHNIDMLAMMPRNHSIFEKIFKSSVSKKVAIDIEIPMLTFHE